MTDFEKSTLIMLCAVIAIIVIALIVFLILSKKKDEESRRVGANAVQMTKSGMPYDDIKNFLPFDDIKDDMIIQEKGDRFTMLIECKGINYYLMSEAEKVSVEEGFIQFLNSLRFPIQIYVQTRTVNLDESISTYKERLNKLQDEFNHMYDSYQAAERRAESNSKLEKLAFELEKKEKVLEYTADLVDNISYLTQNRNVLQKKYYIVVSYHVSEMGLINNFEKNETYRIAREELTNRADSIRGGIASCGVEANILDTFGLTEVMYVAVNRDGSDIFNIKKMIESDMFALSSTAIDPEEKRKELLREEKRLKRLEAEREKQLRLEQERINAANPVTEHFTAGKKASSVDGSTML